MNDRTVENRIVSFLRSVSGKEGLEAGTLLLEEGIIDSLTIMDLIVFIETEFKVRLDFTDLNAAAFRTPAALAETIRVRRRQPASTEPIETEA